MPRNLCGRRVPLMKRQVEARRLQEQSVNVEQQTFAVGLATNLTVIQYQNYLAQARSTEVASKGAYIKAKIALQRATGTTLDAASRCHR